MFKVLSSQKFGGQIVLDTGSSRVIFGQPGTAVADTRSNARLQSLYILIKLSCGSHLPAPSGGEVWDVALTGPLEQAALSDSFRYFYTFLRARARANTHTHSQVHHILPFTGSSSINNHLTALAPIIQSAAIFQPQFSCTPPKSLCPLTSIQVSYTEEGALSPWGWRLGGEHPLLAAVCVSAPPRKFPYLPVRHAPGQRSRRVSPPEQGAHAKLTLPYLFPSIIDGQTKTQHSSARSSCRLAETLTEALPRRIPSREQSTESCRGEVTRSRKLRAPGGRWGG